MTTPSEFNNLDILHVDQPRGGGIAPRCQPFHIHYVNRKSQD
jgi:hypothetical protein